VNDQAYGQQAAIQARRAGQWRLKGWAQLSCPNPRCAVNEVNVFVEENVDVRPFQAPNRCPRCTDTLVWEGWDEK
jgi:hypothetical protein